MPDNDAEILQLFSNPATREQGLILLMNTYQERLYAVIFGLAENHDDTNDILQNVFIKIWKNIGTFRGDAKLFTWLYRVATNEAYNFLKQRNKKEFAAIDNNAIENEPASEMLSSAAIEEKLQHAIDTLPEKQKEVFLLRYYDELPYREMSEKLGTSEGALKASYHHAAKKIEEFLLRD